MLTQSAGMIRKKPRADPAFWHFHSHLPNSLSAQTPPHAELHVMGNGDEQRKKHHKSRGSAQEPQIEQKQLWEINEVILNGNYTRGQTEDGQVYYTLSAARQDLPASFWYRDW